MQNHTFRIGGTYRVPVTQSVNGDPDLSGAQVVLLFRNRDDTSDVFTKNSTDDTDWLEILVEASGTLYLHIKPTASDYPSSPATYDVEAWYYAAGSPEVNRPLGTATYAWEYGPTGAPQAPISA